MMQRVELSGLDSMLVSVHGEIPVNIGIGSFLYRLYLVYGSNFSANHPSGHFQIRDAWTMAGGRIGHPGLSSTGINQTSHDFRRQRKNRDKKGGA